MRAAKWLGVRSVLTLFFIVNWPALADENLTLAGGQSGTPIYRASVGLSSLVKFELLPNDKIDLRPMESSGAIGNVRMLQADDAQLAILPSVTGHAARLGVGSFAGEPPETGFRAIATLWRDALHLVVREDDVATGTIDDLSTLKDRKVFLGSASTGVADANHLLLADLGIETDSDFEFASVTDSDVISAIKRGEVDAFSTTARPPETSFESVFEEPASGLRLLDVTESQMTRANGNHWLWTPYVIRAATYPGQNEDIWTIGLSNLLVVRADVDPDVVYAITKSIFENLAYLKRVDPALGNLSLDTALAGMAMPLHPGALRYFSEAGLIKTPALDEEAASPSLSPVKQEAEQPDTTPARFPPAHYPDAPEHYPDANVASDWPTTGAGGPLLTSTPPAAAPQPKDTRERPEPYWKQRATL